VQVFFARNLNGIFLILHLKEATGWSKKKSHQVFVITSSTFIVTQRLRHNIDDFSPRVAASAPRTPIRRPEVGFRKTQKILSSFSPLDD